MRSRLRKLWETRSPRDRVVIAVVAALVGVALYALLLESANRARAQLGLSVTALRAQASRLELDAAELARVRAMRTAPAARTDLRAQVQAQIAASRLSGGLLRLDAVDANHVQVAFGSVVFADWLEWVVALQAQQVRLEVGRIEALSTPGLVGVTATLARASPQ
jgi:general secretion pathway protein M